MASVIAVVSVAFRCFASTSSYGASTNTKNDNYWDYYLNNTWKNKITDSYEELLTVGTYYTNSMPMSIYKVYYNYKQSACTSFTDYISTKDCDKTGISSWTGYVGLSRYSEMFASQFNDDKHDVESMWFITPSGSKSWGLYDSSKTLLQNPADYKYVVRPTIHLKSDVVIKSGSGTEQDPFIVGLPSSES